MLSVRMSRRVMCAGHSVKGLERAVQVHRANVGRGKWAVIFQ